MTDPRGYPLSGKIVSFCWADRQGFYMKAKVQWATDHGFWAVPDLASEDQKAGVFYSWPSVTDFKVLVRP